jgi:Tat protein secretion system quality control protein TatD with DNase activity
VEYRGEISVPANLVDTLRELSRIKNLSIKELARITTENARRFFGI